jgi:hypothetical protein
LRTILVALISGSVYGDPGSRANVSIPGHRPRKPRAISSVRRSNRWSAAWEPRAIILGQGLEAQVGRAEALVGHLEPARDLRRQALDLLGAFPGPPVRGVEPPGGLGL